MGTINENRQILIVTGRPLLPQRGAVSPAGVSARSQNHAACCSCLRAAGGKRLTGHVGPELEDGWVGNCML
ncbi:hypothetical protein EYF80_004272 [Liparis tanakae]|uniref:Uncharacterized protein n=1 Tax=Liparis tanakae TaxID=230148 RepID=A0A4Z2J611_9TELE|nr:hypothetical protein EYF80_004272 [Liparis tanakae]